ncbi:MAG: tetratricopeptide repeat protein [Anaerolineaceae bacterium]|nr:tetratricopeptide repeat protein [Anaerolineaceae bacterium]
MKLPTALKRRYTDIEFRELVDEIYPEDEEEIEGNLKASKAKQVFEISIRADITPIEKNLWKTRYLQIILDYGFQLKRNWIDAGQPAIQRFEQVIRLGRNVPIANYRLGHIYFKQKNYHQAMINFEMALINNQRCEKPVFRLDTFQEDVAKKFVAFCCLKNFEVYREISLENKKYPELDEQIENYLYLEKDLENLDLLVVRIYKEGRLDETKLINEDSYLDIKDEIEFDKSSICLDGFQSQKYISYLGKGDNFSGSFTLLKNMLTGRLIEENDGEIPKGNTFNQQIRRLRLDLKSQRISETVLRIEKKPGELPIISTKLKIYLFTSIGE